MELQPLLFVKKNAAKRDNEGAVCNSGIGMLFYVLNLFALIF